MAVLVETSEKVQKSEMIEISWKGFADLPNAPRHKQSFDVSDPETRIKAKEFIVHVIRKTPATHVYLDDREIWSGINNLMSDAEDIANVALAFDYEDAPRLVEIDYNIDGDWLD